MSFSLPPAARAYVKRRIRDGQYASASEYFRSLIDLDKSSFQDSDDLEAKLIEGVESGPGREITPGYWERKKDRLHAEDARRRRVG